MHNYLCMIIFSNTVHGHGPRYGLQHHKADGMNNREKCTLEICSVMGTEPGYIVVLVQNS